MISNYDSAPNVRIKKIYYINILRICCFSPKSVIFHLNRGGKMICPGCGSTKINKNGFTHYRKQNYKCKKCDRQFVKQNEREPISDERAEIIRNLLLERISLRGICRVMGVSLTWLPGFFLKQTDNFPDDLAIVKPEKSKITLELDEMWSFVDHKKNRLILDSGVLLF
ncbi:MAG: IS1 family transposase [Desulfobacteraceae bacterium]|nr:IS1 family transposase [Desulfobacteraceae bacterium]